MLRRGQRSRRHEHLGGVEGGSPFSHKNLLTYTEDLSRQPPWMVFGVATAVFLPGVPIGPSSGSSRLIESIDNDFHALFQYALPTGDALAPATFSAYLKAGTRSWIALNLGNDNGVNTDAFFDLSGGAVGAITGGGSAAIVAVGGGVFRCSITIATPLDGLTYATIYPASADTVGSYAGTPLAIAAVAGGLQVERGSAATAYAPRLTA